MTPPPRLTRRCASSQGFTLIEMSIVLVIIGLIVGGVLVGADLIDAAKVKAQISQFQEYQTAFMTFKTKYDCLPGDCANAATFGLGANGNGDDILEAATGSASSFTTPDGSFDGELPLFFAHLSAANLIKGGFTGGAGQLGVSYPRLAINDSSGMIAAGQWQATGTGTTPDLSYGQLPGIYLYAQMCNPAAYDVPHFGNDGCGVMTPREAYGIDHKIDDGNPLTGKIWGYSSYLLGTYCSNSPYTSYNIQTNLPVCQMSFRLY